MFEFIGFANCQFKLCGIIMSASLMPGIKLSINATCLHVLPLVQVFCKWEFQENCGDLRALMWRYDSESELGLMCSSNRFCPCFGMMTEASNTNLETLLLHMRSLIHFMR